MAANAPTGTVTFLFTDMVGSTALWEQFPDELPAVLAQHDGIVRRAIDDNSGMVFATGGDGFAVAFQSASDALAAAVAIQRGLLEREWGRVAPAVRIGIHSGEAHERGGDYFGPVVNRSARLMAAAGGGQILVSHIAASLVSGTTDMDLVDVGAVELRGVTEPMRVMGVIAEGVAEPYLAQRQRRGNLPAPLTEFVGSVAALEARARELRDNRLVTLIGPGGVGKTRLAVEAAATLSNDFGEGTWFVDLAPLGDGTAVAAAVAQVLGVQLQPAASITASVVEWLRGRRLLLVMDNCEHLLGDVAPLITQIVSQCPTVGVLATSREPLGVTGETVRVVASLDAAVEGVMLFCDRARRVNEAFDPSDEDRQVIADICVRLDGIPLAIELAAARARVLTCIGIRDRLDDRFRLLRGAGRSGVDRHQTLRATVQWSYQLLSEAEQMLFDRVSVFSGSFSLEAAEAVVADDVLDVLEVGDLLAALVDKSMVTTQPSQTGTRYRLIETLRQFAEERLAETAAVQQWRDRHFDHYLSSALELSRLLETPHQAVAHDGFVADWANLRAAFWWAVDGRSSHDVEQMLRATAWDATASTRLDHLEWTAGALARPDTRTSLALGFAATWEFVRWDFAAQTAFADEGLLLESVGLGASVCHHQKALSLTVLFGQHDAAAVHLQRSAELAISAGDVYADFWARVFRVYWAQAVAPDRHRECIDAVDAIARRCGAPVMSAIWATLEAQSVLYTDAPDAARAMALSESALEAAQSVGATIGIGLSLSAALLALGYEGDVAQSPRVAQLLRQQIDTRVAGVVYPALQSTVLFLTVLPTPEAALTVLGHFDVVGWFRNTALDRRVVEFETALQGHPGAAEWRTRGATLSFDEVIAVVLGALDTSGVEH